MQHISTEEVLAYVRDDLPEEENLRVETHLSGCRECMERIRGTLSLKRRFDETWEDWTAEKTAAKVIRTRLAGACSGPGSDPALRERIGVWLSRLTRRTRGALEVVLDAPRKTVRASGERLERFFSAEELLRFAPVPPPTRVRGEGEEGRILVSAPGPPWVKVTVEGPARKITVQHQLQDRPWPLVSLIPKGEGIPAIREFRHPADTDYLLAEFEELPDGDYILLLEGPGDAT